MSQFESVQDVNIRVGALPRTTNNKMKYYLTWSSEGLINEYCNPCEAIVNGEKKLLQPLEGHEEIILDGVEYEAFNTSGGLGSMIHTLEDMDLKAENISYKTIRYKGHRALMNFLFWELGLAQRKELLAEIFNKVVPHAEDDVIVIFIQVTGHINGRRSVRTYSNKIYGDYRHTAIQRTTAAGVCAVVDYWSEKLGQVGVYEQMIKTSTVAAPEQIDTKDFELNKFWSVYE